MGALTLSPSYPSVISGVLAQGGPTTDSTGCLFTQGGNSTADGAMYLTDMSDIVGDVTIEFWFMLSNNRSSWASYFGQWDDTGAGSVALMVGATQTICKIQNTEIYVSGTTRWTDNLTPFVWHHCAIVSLSNVWTVYIDGQPEMTGTVAVSPSLAGSKCYLMWDSGTSSYNYMNRWMGGLRITAAARYTAAFTPPTTMYTLDGDTLASQVKALMTFTEAQHLDAIASNQWTPCGNFQTSTAVTKFTPQSGYFTSSSAVVMPRALTGTFDLSVGNFTISAWVYPTAASTASVLTTVDSNDTKFGFTGLTTQHEIALGLTNAGGNWTAGLVPSIYSYNGTTTQVMSSLGNLPLNEWTHLEADVDASGNALLFVNGVQAGSGTIALLPSTNPLFISGYRWNTINTPQFQGYLSEVRLDVGINRHTANFDVPTAAVPADEYTAILLDFHGAPSTLPENQIAPYIGSSARVFQLPMMHLQTAFHSVFTPYVDQAPTTAEKVLVASRGNSRFRQDSADNRTVEQIQADPMTWGGYIMGTCTTTNGAPDVGATVQLMTNHDFQKYSQQTVGADGTFAFHDLQQAPEYYAIAAHPDDGTLQNGQIFTRVTPIPYDFTVSGRLTLNTTTGQVDSDVMITNGLAPFTVIPTGGALPDGASVTVQDRQVVVTGITGTLATDYIFDATIMDTTRGYSVPIEFEITTPDVLPMGKQKIFEGSEFDMVASGLVIQVTGAVQKYWLNYSSGYSNAIQYAKLAEPDGSAIMATTSSSLYPNGGSVSNFLERIDFTLTPTVSGNYYFYCYSDDQSGLYISQLDANGNSSLNQICYVQSATSSWNSYPQQMSGPQALVAGQSYDFSFFHVQGTGGAYEAIGMTPPGQNVTTTPYQTSISANITSFSNQHTRSQRPGVVSSSNYSSGSSTTISGSKDSSADLVLLVVCYENPSVSTLNVSGVSTSGLTWQRATTSHSTYSSGNTYIEIWYATGATGVTSMQASVTWAGGNVDDATLLLVTPPSVCDASAFATNYSSESFVAPLTSAAEPTGILAPTKSPALALIIQARGDSTMPAGLLGTTPLVSQTNGGASRNMYSNTAFAVLAAPTTFTATNLTGAGNGAAMVGVVIGSIINNIVM